MEEKLLFNLRENERKTLLVLEKLKKKASVDLIIKTSGLAHAAVMRAALSLTKNKLISTYERTYSFISLTEEGKYYSSVSLPEGRLLNSLCKLGGEANINEVVKEANLEKKIIPIALGWLTRKGWAQINQGKLSCLKTPPPGKDEEVINLLIKKSSLLLEKLDKRLQQSILILKTRKLIEVEEKTERYLELTDYGWKIVKKGVETIGEVSQLTPEIIRSGMWKKVKIRRFDVTAPGPLTYPGKIHPVQQIIQQIKEIFREMGFTEIRGNIVETAFWNFDALFQPQDHPARDVVDTFYLANPKKGKLPEKNIVNAVAKTHENGWETGSRGWEYSWSQEESKRLVLRTHTTATTIRYLANHKKPPVKVFSVDRVFRNEKLDYKHLAEFHQIEGIVMIKKSLYVT